MSLLKIQYQSQISILEKIADHRGACTYGVNCLQVRAGAHEVHLTPIRVQPEIVDDDGIYITW